MNRGKQQSVASRQSGQGRDRNARTMGRRASGNLLLDALPDEEYAALAHHFRAVDLRGRETLIHADDGLSSVYFPTSGVVSLITLTQSGHTVEANQIGREGMVGLPAFLGVDRMPVEVVVQVQGKALATSPSELRAVTDSGGALSALLKRYIYVRMVESAQNSACNRLHSLEQRTARWLLETADRVERDQFAITHELLSVLLGVQRPRVSEAAARLQQQGVVRYGRGRMRLVNRHRLIAIACDCYLVVRDELRALVLAESGSRFGSSNAERSSPRKHTEGGPPSRSANGVDPR
jgi:CRP-like cAMP-binding protein